MLHWNFSAAETVLVQKLTGFMAVSVARLVARSGSGGEHLVNPIKSLILSDIELI